MGAISAATPQRGNGRLQCYVRLPKNCADLEADDAPLREAISCNGEERGVVVGVDDARKRGTAFLASEVVAFKSASVDARSAASVEDYLRGACRTRSDVCVR